MEHARGTAAAAVAIASALFRATPAGIMCDGSVGGGAAAGRLAVHADEHLHAAAEDACDLQMCMVGPITKPCADAFQSTPTSTCMLLPKILVTCKRQ